MKTNPPFGPSQPVSRASSLGSSAFTPSLHRESHELPGGRLRRSGCEGCGQCGCGEDAAEKSSEPPRTANGVTGWLADRPWLFVVGAFALLIGVWSTFLTLAIKNPVRDVLKNPLSLNSDVRPGH